MLNLDDIVSNKKKSSSALLLLINKFHHIDKIYLYTKDTDEKNIKI